MRVLRLECRNFRNIEKEIIIPCENMNVISGENAQGKTNLLEAIWLFTGTKSFRANKDLDFIKFGCEKAVCELDFVSKNVEKEAKIEVHQKREAFLNQNKLKSPSDLAGYFKAVVFSPNDLSIVKDGPSVRRRFLDIAIGQLYPSYIELLKNYVRAVGQRNKILKGYKFDKTLFILLDSFEEELSELGKKIIDLRIRYIQKLKENIPMVYEGLSAGKEKLEIDYLSSCEKENLREKLCENRENDMLCGFTSVGPHRDDIRFKINSANVREFGSQGQKRSVALALKLAEAEIIKKVSGEYPVFLLDDVMSELDPTRQSFILNHIKEMQTFLTCCEPTTVKRLEEGKIFRVKEGKLI